MAASKTTSPETPTPTPTPTPTLLVKIVPPALTRPVVNRLTDFLAGQGSPNPVNEPMAYDTDNETLTFSHQHPSRTPGVYEVRSVPTTPSEMETILGL